MPSSAPTLPVSTARRNCADPDHRHRKSPSALVRVSRPLLSPYRALDHRLLATFSAAPLFPPRRGDLPPARPSDARAAAPDGQDPRSAQGVCSPKLAMFATDSQVRPAFLPPAISAG